MPLPGRFNPSNDPHDFLKTLYSETPLEEIVAGRQHIGREDKNMAIAYAVSEFLREHRIPYEVLWHPTNDTSLRTAREAGVPSDRVVKAVVLESQGRIFMVLIPANRMIRLEAVEDYVGADVRIADPAVLESLFEDCEPGVVPATGPAYGIATLLDDSLGQVEDLYFDAGDHEELIHVSGSRFREAMGEVEIGQFTCEPERN